MHAHTRTHTHTCSQRKSAWIEPAAWTKQTSKQASVQRRKGRERRLWEGRWENKEEKDHEHQEVWMWLARIWNSSESCHSYNVDPVSKLSPHKHCNVTRINIFLSFPPNFEDQLISPVICLRFSICVLSSESERPSLATAFNAHKQTHTSLCPILPAFTVKSTPFVCTICV